MPAPRKARSAKADQRPSRQHAVIELVPPLDAGPPAPSGIRDEAVTIWTDFWASPVSSAVDRESDLPTLQRWILAWSDWLTYTETLRETPMVEGSMGQVVVNPIAKLIASAEHTIEWVEDRFGMNPARRFALGLLKAQGQLTAAQLNAQLKGKHAGDQPAVKDPKRRELTKGWQPG